MRSSSLYNCILKVLCESFVSKFCVNILGESFVPKFCVKGKAISSVQVTYSDSVQEQNAGM